MVSRRKLLKAGSAGLLSSLISPWSFAQTAQRSADPEILFDDDRRDIAPRRRLIDEGEAIIGGPACKFIHVEPNLS